MLTNACEACRDTEMPRVLVESSYHTGLRQLNIIVSDNGRGLSAHEAEQAFSPFFTTKTNGMGFGLARARRAMRDHDGDVFLEPGLDGGAVATLSLAVPAGRSAGTAATA